MRPIDGDALEEAFYQKMKELLKSTDTPQISNEALSLLCGASLITKAPTIEPDIERINNSVDEYISRKSVTVGLDYIINELNKLITDDSPDDGYTDIKNQVEEIKRGVLNIPPEDVQPVVHGEWIPVTAIYKVKEDQFPQTERVWVDATEPDEIDAVKCSICGEVFDFADARNWCTECGTKMDKRKGAGDEVN